MNIIGKEKIRREMSAKRNSLPEEFIKKNSKEISEKLLNMDIYNNAKNIYIYMDFNGEVDTKEIIADAFSKGKRVAIPKIIENKMEFYYIDDIADVDVGYFGYLEPLSNELAKDEDHLMIMPGVAFDNKKNRIGYGRGFYDKYLAQNECENKIALAYDFQVMEEVPYDNDDIKPDMIITEKDIVN